jgi:threonine/homoserine/homoserine lactone efflux protein
VPDASTFGVFVAASLVLVVVPGPAVFYIVTRSVDQGRPAGFASVLGVGVGGLVHATFAALGLSAILASSATAFSVVKWLGVAYLIWLGIQRLFFAGDEATVQTATPDCLSRIFSQGVVVNVLNPNTALFFFAFLPQFVHPSEGASWLQILALGVTFVAIALISDGLYALLASTVGDWLRSRSAGSGFRRGRRYISGGVYLALGTASAMAGSGKG